MCSTLVRPYGALTGVQSIRTTDRVRKMFILMVGVPLISCFESDCSYRHYLAVAPLPSRAHSPEIGIKVPRPSRACIQLWNLGPSDGVEVFGDDKGEMRCEMVLCIDSGPALELKWCPLPSHDSVCLPKFLQKLAPRVHESDQKAIRSIPLLAKKTWCTSWRIRRRLPVCICCSIPAGSGVSTTFVDGEPHLW
jgi:hypothetical protein